MLTPYRSFWVPEDLVKTYETFKQILKRDGKTVGTHLRGYIKQYVAVHDPGNPQARITSYSEEGSVDTAVIEGRIREYFRARDAEKLDVYWRDILERCKCDVSDLQAALAMAQRVTAWLRSRGIRVWR